MTHNVYYLRSNILVTKYGLNLLSVGYLLLLFLSIEWRISRRTTTIPYCSCHPRYGALAIPCQMHHLAGIIWLLTGFCKLPDAEDFLTQKSRLPWLLRSKPKRVAWIFWVRTFSQSGILQNPPTSCGGMIASSWPQHIDHNLSVQNLLIVSYWP